MCLEDQHRDGVVLRLTVTGRSWCGGGHCLRMSQLRDAAPLFVTRPNPWLLSLSCTWDFIIQAAVTLQHSHL